MYLSCVRAEINMSRGRDTHARPMAIVQDAAGQDAQADPAKKGSGQMETDDPIDASYAL